MGAVTNVNKKTFYHSAGKQIISDVTFSGTYGAGGDTYTLAQFGISSQIDAITGLVGVGSATTGYVVAPDLTNKKLRLLGGAASGVALAETGTAGQTGTVARLVIYADDPYL